MKMKKASHKEIFTVDGFQFKLVGTINFSEKSYNCCFLDIHQKISEVKSIYYHDGVKNGGKLVDLGDKITISDVIEKQGLFLLFFYKI
jgi:hypothetical protein